MHNMEDEGELEYFSQIGRCLGAINNSNNIIKLIRNPIPKSLTKKNNNEKSKKFVVDFINLNEAKETEVPEKEIISKMKINHKIRSGNVFFILFRTRMLKI